MKPTGYFQNQAWPLAAATILALFSLDTTRAARSANLPPSPPARTGGDFQAALTQDSGCRDPWQTTLRTQLEYQRQIVDSLIYQGRDGAYTPWLAESWTVNTNATEFTFHLRRGVTFTDGTAFDAATVKTNLDAMKAMGAAAPTPASYFGDYTGTDVIDPQTVVVKFSKPNAQFLFGVSTANFGMYSTPTATLDAASRCAGKAAASGPFRIDSYAPNERIHMVRNASYHWGPEALPNKGPAYLDTITYNIVTNSTAEADGLISGRLQMALGIADQSLDQVTKAGMRQLDYAQAGAAWSFIINPKKGNIADIAVRQAMNIAIDRSTLMMAMPTSITSAAKGIFAPTHPFFKDQSAALAFAPDKAKAILDKAGWKLGPGGIRVKDHKRLRVDVIYYQTAVSFTSMMELIKQQLADVGIDLTLTPVTANEERQRRAEGNFETRLSKFTGADPIILAQLVAGFDPTIDHLLAEQGSTTDPATRKKIVSDLLDYIMQNAFLIPVYDQNASTWWRPDISNMTFDLGDLSMMAQVALPK